MTWVIRAVFALTLAVLVGFVMGQLGVGNFWLAAAVGFVVAFGVMLLPRPRRQR